MSNDPLLQPYRLKNLTLRNRIMVTSHEPAYPEDGLPKERYRAYHVERAKGGVALTMTAGSAVVAEGNGFSVENEARRIERQRELDELGHGRRHVIALPRVDSHALTRAMYLDACAIELGFECARRRPSPGIGRVFGGLR